MSKSKRNLIVFCCMLLQAIPFGIAQNVPPLFIKPLEANFGFSLQSIGYIFTIGAIAASFVSPIAGKFYHKYSTKIVMFGGLVLSGVGILINCLATTLPLFLVASAITQIGTITFSGLGIPYLIATWFDKKEKATALGIAFAGGSIGNFFLQPTAEYFLSKYHIHTVYFIFGVASLVVGTVIILGFIHSNKEINQNKKSNTSKNVLLEGIGYKKTLKLKSFWTLSVFFLLIGLAISALSTQYANFLGHMNVSPEEIGLVGSVFAVSCLCGNVMGGVLFSKLGVYKAMLIAFILQLLAIFSLFVAIFNSNLALMAGFGWALFYGLNVYSYMSAPALMVQNLFGMKDSSQTLGTFSIFFAVGFAVGNIIFGFFVDKMNFTVAWSSILCYTLVGFIGLLSTIKVIASKKYAQVASN